MPPGTTRPSEVEYYGGVVDDLMKKWNRMTLESNSSSSNANQAEVDPMKKVTLFRRITKALLKYEAEIPFVTGKNFGERQFDLYMNLFNQEAVLRRAMTVPGSEPLPVPLNQSKLIGTMEACLFMDCFTSAIMEWIHTNALLRRQGLGETMLVPTIQTTPDLKGAIQSKIELALNAADGDFKADEHILDDGTSLLLCCYRDKLLQLAQVYSMQLPPSAGELARKQAEVEAPSLPVIPKPQTQYAPGEAPSEVPFYFEEAERKNVEALAMRILQRKAEERAEKTEWTPYNPEGRPLEEIKLKLTQFYAKFNKEKLEDVDAILEHYAGREVELFEALQVKYCGQPAIAPPPPTATTSTTAGGSGADLQNSSSTTTALTAGASTATTLPYNSSMGSSPGGGAPSTVDGGPTQQGGIVDQNRPNISSRAEDAMPQMTTETVIRQGGTPADGTKVDQGYSMPPDEEPVVQTEEAVKVAPTPDGATPSQPTQPVQQEEAGGGGRCSLM